jgi:hypothetical protein
MAENSEVSSQDRETDSAYKGQRSKLDRLDLSIKLGLATFSFLLGLLATYIVRTYLEPKKALVYSISETPLVVVRGAAAHLSELPNQSQFTIRIQNIGDLPVAGFAFRVVFDDNARIVTKQVKTEPRMEVPAIEEPLQVATQMRVGQVTLAPGQAVVVIAVVESPQTPKAEVFAALGTQSVAWHRVSATGAEPLEVLVADVVKLGVLYFIVPGLIATVPSSIALFFFGIKTRDKNEQPRAYMSTMAAAQAISTVVRYVILASMAAPVTRLLQHVIR